MKALRALWVVARAIAHAVAGLRTIAFRFPALDAAQREREVSQWAQRMLDVLGIALEVHGTPPAHGPMLLVSNHLSWLDILVMHAARFCRFVSKADVKHWPLIGRLATGAGTIYIERERRRDAMRVVHHVAEHLSAGDIVAVFPEGTTGDGSRLLPFHANLIQAAISAGSPVQPVALAFLDAATRRPAAGPRYIGDETLAGSLWRTVTGPPIVAVVAYGEPQHALGRDRRSWAAALHEAVDDLRKR